MFKKKIKSGPPASSIGVLTRTKHNMACDIGMVLILKGA
jgi:hypothetical protein